MKTTLLTARQTGSQLAHLIAECDTLHWAVAWATETELAVQLFANERKIRQLVIGTDFDQTSPQILRTFKPVKACKVVLSKAGSTFHPKVYCFVSGSKVTAIVGSANFTNGGTHSNEEASLLLEGDIQEETLQKLLASVTSWWKGGDPITGAFLSAYELRWEANKKHRDALKKPLRIYKPSEKAAHPKLREMSWENYVAKVRGSFHHTLEGRLEVLKRARLLLDGGGSFRNLQDWQRKGIAGVLGSKEAQAEHVEGVDWAWFGSMRGSGVFQSRIAENDPHLSAALDRVPPSGDVQRDDYEHFVDEFKKAFADSQRQGGVPSATRLLAMKRPDYFVCVDSANREELGGDLGFSPTTLKLENYWEWVVEPITQARWWNAARPAGENGAIWDGRSAMLDAIYYTPKTT